MATETDLGMITVTAKAEEIEFDDIKDYLNAIEAGVSNFYDNPNFPDIGRLFQSYAIHDKLSTFAEIISDKDVIGKLGFEVSKMAGALAGMKVGIAAGIRYSPIKHPLAIIFAGSAGAFMGEEGVAQFETEIRNSVNELIDSFDMYGAESSTFQQAYSKSMLDLKTLALNSGFKPALESQTLAGQLFEKLDDVASNYSVKNLTSNSNLSQLQQKTYIENGKPTTLFYSQDSDLLMYGDTIDNPNKISFTNNDGSYEVWEKVNGFFTQTVKIDNVISNDISKSTLLNVENDFNNFYNDGLIDKLTYQLVSQNFTGYYLNDFSKSYTPLVNEYFTPIDIGAFYESSTSKIDNSSSIAKKTFKLLNSSNQTITKTGLNALDVNKDGKLSGNEITSLKTWKDLNEDGIAQNGEITSLTETIYAKDYDTYTKGNAIYQNPTSPTQPSIQTLSSNYASLVQTVTIPTVPNSNFDRKVSLVKFISLNNRLYQANFFDLDLKEVA
jgi:hypothetical protein